MSARHPITTFLVARGAVGGAVIAAAAALAAVATAPGKFYIGGYLLSMLIAALVGAIVGGVAAVLLALPLQYRPRNTALTWTLAISAGLLIGVVSALLTLRAFNGPEVAINLIAAAVGICSAVFASFVVVRARQQAKVTSAAA
ncbi:hypothetical protein [Curtobacterium citreum]|uniref:hypothetical protein n=1 Tax=Curtobacterium citreum TaxID=2036 RepID=UPI001FE258A2|nr:hypothetical protein [Curtobacterium albidum]